jgi:hypothetical protein
VAVTGVAELLADDKYIILKENLAILREKRLTLMNLYRGGEVLE